MPIFSGRRRARLLAAVLLLSTILPGCGTPVATVDTKAIDARISKGLGTVQFIEDPTRQVSVPYTPGQAATLSATDSGGYQYELSIPAQALPEPITLTMTPLSNLVGPSGMKLVSGVSFGPDGTALAIPATLTIKSPAAGTQPLPIYVAKKDGSQLLFASKTGDGTAQIFHFSISVVADPAGADQEAQQAYAAAKQLAQDLLTTPVSEAPGPPRINLRCIDPKQLPAATQVVQNYANTTMQPEASVVGNLLGAFAYASAIHEIVTSKTLDASELVPLTSQMADRIGERLQTAAKQYHDQDDAFVAVSFAATAAADVMAMFDGDIRGEAQATRSVKIQALHEVMGKWAADLVDKLLGQTRGKHDYSNLSETLLLASAAKSLGKNMDAVHQELANAYIFTLKIDEDVNAPFTTAAGTPPSTGNLLADGFLAAATSLSFSGHVVGTVTMTPTEDALAYRKLTWTGSGTLTYTKLEDDPNLGFKALALPTFTADVTGTLSDSCNQPTFSIEQTPYGGVENFSDGNISEDDVGIMRDMISGLIELKTGGPPDVVQVPLQDGQATSTGKTTLGDFPEYAATLKLLDMNIEYTVTHAPK